MDKRLSEHRERAMVKEKQKQTEGRVCAGSRASYKEFQDGADEHVTVQSIDMDMDPSSSIASTTNSSKMASTLDVTQDDKLAAYSTSLPELPAPMKNAQGVIFMGYLYLGGGYTGNSKTDAMVYVYDIASCKWTSLPVPCPIKWSGLAVHKEKLVLVGGKLTQCHSTDLSSYTNKVAVWNEHGHGGGGWEHSLPSMSTGRLCPTVISHHGCLIVAGGNKGVLDYRTEVLHAEAQRWMCGPSLPLPCFMHTSTTVGGEWYLMDQRSGQIQHASLSRYVAIATGKSLQDGMTSSSSGKRRGKVDVISFPQSRLNGDAAAPESSKLSPLSLNNDTPQSLWKRLPTSPPQLPFKIASTNCQLLALSNSQDSAGSNITLHLYQNNNWTKVEGRFPSTLSSGLLLGGQRDQDTVYVLGGQVSHHYTNSAHKLALTTPEKLKVIKKSRQLQLLSD